LSYVSFSAFSEEEIGFVLRGFIALNNGESLSQGNLWFGAFYGWMGASPER